jgi:Protein of unknown function (DUF1579)
MRKTAFVGAAAVVAMLGLTLRAQDSKDASAASSPYKVLAMEEGVWDAEITLKIPGQDTKSKGVETNRMIGGKWLISEFKGEMFGTQFEGSGQNGYDAKKGKYVASWVDSMSKSITLMEGSYDEKTKTLTITGDTENPESGEPMTLRLETQFTGEDTRVFNEFVRMGEQKEFMKLMEVKFTKRKK